MYNCRTDLRKISILGILVLFGLQNQTFGFDLTDELSSQFQKNYNGGFSDGYVSRSYSSNFSKDPFGDAMTNVEDMSMQLKIAGIEYVKGALAEKHCSLDDKKIWAILYNYLPEFRAELARSLKMNLGDYDTKKYVFDEETILKYCKEYYVCEKSQGYSAWATFNEEVIKGNDLRGISASTPADIESNCKEFFQQNYREGRANEQRIQNTHMAQIASDRYWNETTKDSPYDIMVDLGIYSQLLYQDAEDPEKPVFYNLDTFKESKTSLNESKNSDGLKPDNGREKRVKANGGVIFPGGAYGSAGKGGGGSSVSPNSSDGNSISPGNSTSLSNQNGVDLGKILTRGESREDVGGTSLSPQNRVVSDNLDGGSSSPTPLPLYGEGGYDDVVDGLAAFNIKGQTSNFEGSLCGDDDEETEPEGDEWGNYLGQNGGDGSSQGGSAGGTTSLENGTYEGLTRAFSELSNKEYQELVDYMTKAVDEYADLPEDKEKEMEEKAGDTSSYVGDSSAGQLSNSANKIKNCWKSCRDLRIDLKATCMMKCACGHLDSPIFDPNKTEGLGPIFVIRYCSVPSTDTKFSKGGKRIHSIEEGVKEIYGAVDKLSREGRLGIWTQQYNFLDSSTKKMKIADSFAFTIDIEFVDLVGKMPTQSEQYQKKELKDNNRSWQSANRVSNPLNSPVYRNSYRVVGTVAENVGDYSSAANSDMNRKIQKDLNKTPKPFVDPIDNTDAYRYNMFASHFGRLMDQQGALWVDATNYTSEMSSYAEMLYAKEKRRKNDPRMNKSE